MSNEIIIPCLGYTEMSENWDLPQTLLGGTKAMRLAGEKWLPKELMEEQYAARLNRSILYNGYRDTLLKLSNRPFSHPMQFQSIPEHLNYLIDDVDGTSKSFEAFAKEVMKDLINFGIAHIFVDHSEHPEIIEGAVLTKADEERIGARVILNIIHPPDLIGWRTEIIDKRTKLTQIRIKETITEPQGLYGDKDVNYVKLYTPNTWEVHKEVIKGNREEKVWQLDEQGEYTFGRIPLVTIYANRIGFMMAEPSLMDLAWLNLAHWQSYSDQRNILRLTRFGLLFGTGFPKAQIGKPLGIGPSKAIILTNTNGADLKYVEHSGASIEAGSKDLEDIEIKMEILGQQPLMRSAPLSTATAKKIDETRNVSQLKTWVTSLECGLLEAMKMSCEWRKIEPPKDMRIEIFKDFEVSIYGTTDKELLLKARQAGEITRERFLREEQRRGVFSGDMDPEEESKLVDDEGINELKGLIAAEEDEDEGDEN